MRIVSWMVVMVVPAIYLFAGQTPAKEDEKKSDEPVVEKPVVKKAPSRKIIDAHDFSDFQDGTLGSCGACHVPHVQGVRTLPERVNDADLELYRIKGQREVFVPNQYTPGPTSLVCLGCHDGTVATSAIGSSHALLAGVREGFEINGGIGGRDHPIGIRYPSNRKDYRTEAFIAAKGKIRLPEGRVECISCHDPHNSTGEPKMLVMSNRRSALCLSCHIK